MRLRFLIIPLLIIWTTARHEGSHALAAYILGADIQELKLLPGIHAELGFYFGYVIHTGVESWLIDAAPFFIDGMLMLLALAWLSNKKTHKHFRIILLFGVVSPMADMAYNYQGGFWRNGTDVWDLLEALPDLPVHLYFVITMTLGYVTARKLLQSRRLASRIEPLAANSDQLQ
ncbi:hypothetical protein BFP97_07275 [Roseivirga sp. 4D4]|uniref:hypothetical protein n=1 Tax=Roseivirga sp. 4D4 TaxID=1889784 RepID=UPI000853091D|nr:hypothetical protein [Roseivirga sp. 4D4]OEK01328.1 hypothetical protein BFP97_07275 [Roseivirga sp. 4D4]